MLRIALGSAALAITPLVAVPADEAMPPIQQCVVSYLTVDGLPLVRHGWCAWDRDTRRWVPMSSDIAAERVFGIKRIRE